MFNRGFRAESPKEKDYLFGGITGLSQAVLQEDGQWDPFLPEPELQRKDGFESMACVSYSALNCLEILAKRKGNLFNLSDRYLAKVSGTSPRGNWMGTVAETLRKGMPCREAQWPWPEGDVTWDSYYSEPSKEAHDGARIMASAYDIGYDYVTRERMAQALRTAPLQVALNAWGPEDSAGITRYNGGEPNHCVTVYGFVEGQYWKVYDHYEKSIRKVSWDYPIRAVLRYSLEESNQAEHKPMELDNNTLVQLVEGEGGFGLYLDGKLFVDDTDKILASFVIRNSGDIKGKTVAVTKEDWDSVPKFTLKNEPI